MSESLVEKLNRMQGEIDSLNKRPIPKPVNYKEGISLLEEANKNLDRMLSHLNKRYELIDQELKLLQNKKSVDYSDDIKLLNKELTALKSKKPVKQIDYSEDIKSLKKNNERLEASISELNNKNNELDKSLLLQNKKPVKQVDYKKDIELLNKSNGTLKRGISELNNKNIELNKNLTALKSKKPVKQIDYKEDISKLNGRIDPLVKSMNEIKNKPVTPLIAKKIKTVDHSEELAKINSEIKNIKDKVSNKKEINLIEEIKKTVNQNYINELYRNK